jgi:uncharacterized DUF497 family protein
VFEWDPRKAALNFRKHGVSFAEAATCLSDAGIVMGHDLSHSQAEDRYVAIGKSSEGRVLTLIFTLRKDKDGEKIFRIISARQASKKERNAYPRS